MSDLIGWRHRWIEAYWWTPAVNASLERRAKTFAHKLIYSESRVPEKGANGEDQWVRYSLIVSIGAPPPT